MIKNKIKKEKGIFFISAEQEKNFVLATADLLKNKRDRFRYKKNKEIYLRKNQRFISEKIEKINFIDLETIQMMSIGTGLIPFLEHNDANRALMGSNMQRQAVGIENPENPRIETGIEKEIGRISNSTIKSGCTGLTNFISVKKIIIKNSNRKDMKKYTESFDKKKQLQFSKNKNIKKERKKYINYTIVSNRKSNQNTFLRQVPTVSINEPIRKGQIITDGNSTKFGKIALGKTLLIGYMGWEGYNFEDAVVISKRLVDENIFTSYHIKKYKTFIITSKNEEVRVEN